MGKNRPRPGENLGDEEGILGLTASADPLLARLGDNERDSAYDRLPAR